MAALDPTSPKWRASSVPEEPVIGGVMESPAVASTYALLTALTAHSGYSMPAGPHVPLSRWVPEATALLQELLHDQRKAERVMEDLLEGRPTLVVDTGRVVKELGEILQANIDLAHAEY